jgi:WD40 repeat protein
VVVVAVVAVVGFVKADHARDDADARLRDATASKLSETSQLILAGQIAADDVFAMQALAAALAISDSQVSEYPLLTVLNRSHDLLKVMDVPAVVTSVAFSPDSPAGPRIATGYHDGTLRLWDPATGTPVGEPLRGHENGTQVNSVAFSPDGLQLVSGGEDGTVRMWDPATEKPIGEPMRHGDVVTSVAFSPDSSRIVSGGLDNTVRLWDTTGRPIGEPMRHDNAVEDVAFSPDGTRLVSGGDDKTVRLWAPTERKAAVDGVVGSTGSGSGAVSAS